MGLISEFKEFAMKGNVVDLAVGVIIGAAFGAVVTSFVEDVLMPPLGWAISGVDFEELSLDIPVGKMEAAVADATGGAEDAGDPTADAGEGEDAPADDAGDAADPADPAAAPGDDGTVGTGEDKVVRIMYGKFINAVIRFIIQAAAIFLVIKVMNRLMREKEEEVTEEAEPKLSTEEKLLTEIRDALKSNNG